MTKFKILYVSPHCPVGPAYGARQRAFNIARLLGEFGHLSYLIACPDTWEIEDQQLYEAEKVFNMKRVLRFHKSGLNSMKERLSFEISSSHLKTEMLSISEKEQKYFLDLYNDNDLVWFHTALGPNILRIAHSFKSILDIDDLKSRYYFSTYKNNNSIVRAVKDLRMSLLWKRRERQFLERFRRVTVCSDDDKRYLGGSSKIYVVPNGFEAPKETPVPTPILPERLGFIGTFDYFPNREGVSWFIENVWPLIKGEKHDARLRLVGSKSKEYFDLPESDIDALGYVEDVEKEISTWSGMIIPIRSGAGTRIKIAEGFARKCPMISTSLGCFGYRVENNINILLADTDNDFAEACLKLLNSDDLGTRIADNGWADFKSNYTWDSYLSNMQRVIKSLDNDHL